MNKKYILKNILCIIFALSAFCIFPKAHNAENTVNEVTQSKQKEEKNEEENEFNFIKSNNCENNFFYSDNWLLYGGIILVAVSITGIVFTLKPKKPRNLRKKQKTNRR